MKTLAMEIQKKIDTSRRNGIRFVGDMLLESEMLSSDGSLVLCNVCGKPKFEKVRSVFLSKEYWMLYEGKGCDCVASIKEAQIRKEQSDRMKAAYKTERFMGVSKGYLADCSFSDSYYKNLPAHILSPMRAVWKYCSDFEDTRNHGMYVCSFGPGLCKTSMMACARNKLLDDGVSCILTNVAEITDAYYGDRETFDAYGRVEVLIIDDIGIQNPKEKWATDMGKINSALYELLNVRMLSERNPTLFTSNYEIVELLERGLIPQTVDRIRALAGKHVLKISGQSVRGL